MTLERSHIYAAGATSVVAALVLLCLLMTHLRLIEHTPAQTPVELAMLDDEVFVDVLEPEPQPTTGEEAAPALNETVENNQATAPAASGPDLTDNGPKGPAPAPVTQTKPSAVKQTPPKQTTPEEIAAKEAERKRQEAQRAANAQTANAFANSSGKNNTDNSGTKPGNAGSPSGKSSAANGHGVSVTGSGGGKWGLPGSTSVAMSETGRITFSFTIDPDGSIRGLDIVPDRTSAYYTSNTAVINRLKAEIRAHIQRQAKTVKETEPRNARIVYNIK